MWLRILTIGFALAWSSLSSATPTFDCTKAKSIAEHAICASDDLAFLDNEISKAYSFALKSGATNPADQRAWLQRRDTECKAVHAEECVRNLMWGRFDALTANLPPVSEDTIMVDGDEHFVRLLWGDDERARVVELKKEMMWKNAVEMECSRVVELRSGRENLVHGAECMVFHKDGTKSHAMICNASMTDRFGYGYLGARATSFQNLGFFAWANCAGG